MPTGVYDHKKRPEHSEFMKKNNPMKRLEQRERMRKNSPMKNPKIAAKHGEMRSGNFFFRLYKR